MKRAYAVYSRKSRGCFLFMYTAHKTAMSQTMAIINIRISIPARRFARRAFLHGIIRRISVNKIGIFVAYNK